MSPAQMSLARQAPALKRGVEALSTRPTTARCRWPRLSGHNRRTRVEAWRGSVAAG